jgi:hypothetical protein
MALSKLGAGADLIGGEPPNNEHDYDVSLGQAYALRTLSAAEYRTVAAGVADALTKKFGSADPATWRDKRDMFQQTSLGAEQPPPMPFFDRGTYEQLIELQSPGGVAAARHYTRKRGHHRHRKPRRLHGHLHR